MLSQYFANAYYPPRPIIPAASGTTPRRRSTDVQVPEPVLVAAK
jgi:hypothetical protein